MILYYITDRKQLAGAAEAQLDAAVERVRRAAAAGVDYVQLREKDLSGRELERLARRSAEAISSAGASSRTKLLINSRVDVALAAGAAGVHLPAAASGGISAADARSVFDKAGISNPVIAVSCHSEAEVEHAWSEGADFAVVGPVFRTQGSEPLGLDILRRLATRTEIAMPVLALGGVTVSNAAECRRAGAAGVAGIRLFQQGDLQETVARLRR